MNKNILITILLIIGAGGAVYYFVTNNMPKRTVQSTVSSYLLYSPSEESKEVMFFAGVPGKEGFELYPGVIYKSSNMVNEIKQFVLKLIDVVPEGFVSYIPEGVMLRDVFMDNNKICYIDFSEDISINHKGGTSYEYFTVYSIVNSLFYNFPEINGVRILINGKETDTIAGHINIDGILKPDTDFYEYSKDSD